MKKLIFIFILTVMSVNVAHAKGGGGGGHASSHATMAHATVASHMMAHGSSNHQPDKLTGKKLTKEESITVFVTFFTFLIITGFAVAWSGE
jgi:hypothetical protein